MQYTKLHLNDILKHLKRIVFQGTVIIIFTLKTACKPSCLLHVCIQPSFMWPTEFHSYWKSIYSVIICMICICLLIRHSSDVWHALIHKISYFELLSDLYFQIFIFILANLDIFSYILITNILSERSVRHHCFQCKWAHRMYIHQTGIPEWRQHLLWP